MSENPVWLLLVEDHPVDAMIFTQLCDESFSNIEVVQKRTIQDAVRLMQQHKLDVVFADLNLLDSTGVGSIEELRKAIPDIPIVALTGTATEQTVERCRQAGAGHFLHKADLSAEKIAECLSGMNIPVQKK